MAMSLRKRFNRQEPEDRTPTAIQPTEEPADGDSSAEFGRALRALRERSGNPPLRTLAERVGYSHTVLSQALSGRTLPTWSVTAAIVRTCGGDESDWHGRWLAASERAVRDTTTGAKTVAVNDAGTDSLRQFGAALKRRIDGT